MIEGIFRDASRDPEVRKKLRERIEKEGLDSLYAELQNVDAEAAERIPATDKQRIQRALEVYYITGEPITALQKKSRRSEPRYPHTLLVITRDREDIYARIEKRLDLMFEKGLVREVEKILEQGYSPDLHPLKALGYREIVSALRGEVTLGDAAERMKKISRRYAKRQLTWFRGMSEAIWLNISGLRRREILEAVENIFLKGKA